MNKKTLSVVGQIVLFVLIVWLLGERLVSGFSQAVDVLSSFHWQLVAATVLFVLAVPTTGVIWGRVLNSIEPKAKIKPSQAARVHVLSWLLKYIPGQAGSVLTKIFWAKKEGVSQKHVAASVVYENVFLVSSAVLLSVPILGIAVVEQLGADGSLVIPLLLTALVLPLLIPAVFSRLLQTALKVFRRKPIQTADLLDGSEVVKSQTLFLVPRILNAVGFVVLVSIFYEPVLPEALQLGATYVLAGVLGILAFFVPSGLGVREAVIAIVAAPIIGADTAAACALIARVCATAADGVLGLSYLGTRRLYGN